MIIVLSSFPGGKKEPRHRAGAQENIKKDRPLIQLNQRMPSEWQADALHPVISLSSLPISLV